MEHAILRDRRAMYPLALALAAAVAWQLVAYSPVRAACAVGAMALVIYSFARPVHVLALLLVLKPLVDLTWDVPVLSVGPTEYNFQTLQGVFVAGLGFLHLAASWRRPRVDSWPLAALVLLMGVSTALRPGMAQASAFARLTSGLMFFLFAGVCFATEIQVRRLFVGILAATTIIIGVGFLQVAGLVPYTWSIDWETITLDRVSGGYEHPADLARLLLVAHPLALMFLWRSRSWQARAAWLAFLAAAYAVLILSYHRMGWCAVLLELLVWLGLKRRAGVAALVLAGLAAAVAIHWEFVAELFRTVLFLFRSNTDLWTADFLSGRGHALLAQGHLSYWLRSGPLVWFFGFGTPQLEIQGIVYDQTDCDYLRILVSYGVAGLVLYCATLVWCLRRSVHLVREAVAAGQDFWRDLGMAAVTLTLGVMLFSLTTYSLNYPILVWMFFTVISISVAAQRRLKEVPHGSA